MTKLPRISSVLEKKHPGKVVLSWDGKILAIAKDSFLALQKAKKIMPSIESKEFLISRIHGKYLVAGIFLNNLLDSSTAEC